MSSILEIVGKPGIASLLRGIASSSESTFQRTELESRLQALAGGSPAEAIEELIDTRLLQKLGRGLAISDYGQRTSLLVEALEGEDINDVFRRLRRLSDRTELYELVRQGMTTRFLKTLMERPRFGRLYFCSPWINLTDHEAAILRYAAMQTYKTTGRAPEVLVITRPPELQPEAIHDGLKPFREVSAEIVFLKRLHSKLYIREPDENGGSALAIIGSENLTQSNNLELGIQINGDGYLISQLIAYFYELSSYASEA